MGRREDEGEGEDGGEVKDVRILSISSPLLLHLT